LQIRIRQFRLGWAQPCRYFGGEATVASPPSLLRWDLVKDATTDYSDDEMHSALDVTIPSHASAIVTTSEIVDR
jgi:hypothetical protein